MEPDLALVIGLVLFVFSVPSMLSAFSESRPPRVSLLVLLAAGGLVIYAMGTKPGGYTAKGMADAVYRVVADIIS